MRIDRARWMPVALVALGGLVLVGCSAGRGFSSPNTAYGVASALPGDLPENPAPCTKYCKQWVEPTYRMVPKLVPCACEKAVVREEIVMETRAREVLVKPKTTKMWERCGQECDQELVKTKPGGFRWVGEGNCYQYCEQCPEYKWCNKKVKEGGIQYCVEDPAKYKTIVETVPVKRQRVEYIPPQYKIQYVKELYKPGHAEWVPSCDPSCSMDKRKWSKPFKGSALTCDCPSTN